jgi:hypothetical protein
MLKSTTLKTASTLASKLADTGKIAVPKPNTLLQELVGASLPTYDVIISSADDLHQAFYAVESTTTGTLEDPSDHSRHLDGIIKDLSSVVTAHVSYAKNTVKPLVVDMARAIEDYLVTYKGKSAAEMFEISILDLPELVSDDSFLDTLKAYQSKTILKPDLRLVLDAKPSADILGLVTYGYAKTDRLVVEWLSNRPSGFIERVYNSFFTSSDIKDVLSYDDVERLNVYERCDHAIAILLMASHLFDTVDPSATVELAVYRNAAAQYRDYAGALVVDCLAKIALLTRTEQLIIETSPTRYSAKLNGAVYRQWLQTGGSPEIILGFIVSGDVGSSKSVIDGKAAAYMTAWNSYCTFYNVDLSNRQTSTFREYLVSQFLVSLREPLATETAYITATPGYHATVTGLLQTYVDGLTKDQMLDVFSISLYMVAQIRFHYTSAFNILNDIQQASIANPNVDVREAALLAVIHYVTDYLGAQITMVTE